MTDVTRDAIFISHANPEDNEIVNCSSGKRSNLA